MGVKIGETEIIGYLDNSKQKKAVIYLSLALSNDIVVFSTADLIHCFVKLVFHSLSTHYLNKKLKKSAT